MNYSTLRLCGMLACAASLALGAAPPARADVIVIDNGPPNQLEGHALGFFRQAEDFSLNAAYTVTGVRFWSLEASGAYRGSLSWSIMDDAGGMPGATLFASGKQSSVLRSKVGAALGMTEYSNAFALNAPLSLAAGSYWLVLHNGDATDYGDPNAFYWESAAANGSHAGQQSDSPGGAWRPNDSEHAFQILVSAVPEPRHALLLLTGLAAVCARRHLIAQGEPA